MEITALAPGGDAVGRQVGGAADGRVTFVPFAAPGELVRARLVRERARVAWAELTGVERGSAARVAPPCPLFGRCGGCQWQHVDQLVQRRAKGEIVARALGLGPTEATAVGPDYGYRERARLAVALADDPAQGAGTPAALTPPRPGPVASSPAETGQGSRAPAGTSPGPARVLGFRGRRSHEIVDVATCPLLATSLAAALPEARRRASGVRPGGEIALLLGAAGIVAGDADGRGFRVRVGGSSPGAAPGPGPPELPPVLDVEDMDLTAPAGWPNVSEPGGRPLCIPPGGFAQVSRAANAALVSAVADALSPRPGRVLELFAGSGNFTRLLVERASAVIASDGDRAAVARGRRNVPEADWRDAAALGPTVLPVDTVVVDPPREGLDERSLALCAAGQRLVYVSCDPQTLNRDMGHLLRRGLRLSGAVAFDAMPQTHHVEVVALFTRR